MKWVQGTRIKLRILSIIPVMSSVEDLLDEWTKGIPDTQPLSGISPTYMIDVAMHNPE